MVVILAPVFNKIYKSFTHNLLTRSQGKYTFISLIGIHKKFISNVNKFESGFGGGKHGCVCIAIGNQQYALHSQITIVCPRKPDRMMSYLINPIHVNIYVKYPQCRKISVVIIWSRTWTVPWIKSWRLQLTTNNWKKQNTVLWDTTKRCLYSWFIGPKLSTGRLLPENSWRIKMRCRHYTTWRIQFK